MFLWWCPKAIPDNSGRFRPPPADFHFFSISKKALFLWYTFSQNHHSTDDLKCTNIAIVKWNFKLNTEFNISFSPLRFNDRFHHFLHAINELLSVLNRPCVPNMLEYILPHVHCSLVIGFFSRLSKSSCVSSKVCANSVSSG